MTNLQNPDYTSLSKNAFFAPKMAIFATLKGLCSHKIQPKVLKLHKSYFYVCWHQKMPGSNQNKKLTQKRDTLMGRYKGCQIGVGADIPGSRG